MGNGNKKNKTDRRQFLRRFLTSIPVVAVGSQFACGSKSGEKENPYEYDLTDFKKIDPKWLTYEEQIPIPLPFELPHALTIDASDRLLVSGDKELLILDTEGQTVHRFNVDRPAKCLAVSADDMVYSGMTDHIEVFNFEGQRLARWEPLDREALITSVAVSGASVYTADAGNKIVLKYDLQGNVIGRLGEKNPAKDIPGFIIPSPFFDLAVDREERLWVVNPGRYQLENYDERGDLLSSWGKPSWRIEGFCGCCNPTHIAILPDGRFVTSEKGLPRVKVYNQAGQLQAVVADPDAFDENTVGLDLAVDTSSRIYVLDPSRNSIRIFQAKENLT